MGLFSWIFGGKERGGIVDEATTSSITAGTPAYEWLVGNNQGYGKPLSENEAMAQHTVYACVSLIGGAVASLPLHIYKRSADSRERVVNDLWWILNEQMTTTWSSAVGWEFAMQSMLLHGDMFFRIDRASLYSSKIVGFTPLHPSTVDVRKENGRLVYVYNEDGNIKACDQDDMIHVPNVGFDGKRGMSQIRYVLRQPVNIAKDASDQAGAFLGEGMRPDLALLTPKETRLQGEQIDELRSQWRSRYNGISNSKAPIVLTGGVDIKQLTMTAVDAQLLETRKLQAEQSAQIFGVPPHMIGMTEKTTSWGSGIEQQSISFVKYTLQRHLVKIEQEINRKCHRTERLFCEFDTKGLERGDLKTRNESYRIALGRAGEPSWITVNEVRRAENLPPIEGGDKLFSNQVNEKDTDAAQ